MYNQEEEYYPTKDEILELLNSAISSLEYEDNTTNSGFGPLNKPVIEMIKSLVYEKI